MEGTKYPFGTWKKGILKIKMIQPLYENRQLLTESPYITENVTPHDMGTKRTY
jgi:hypothetical protein